MIVILGATGFTGKLICQELHRLGAQFVLAGRNQAKLRRLSDDLAGALFHPVDLDDPASLSKLCGYRVLLNCAGPFSIAGETVVQHCLKESTHYLDITGEQSFIKLIYEKYSTAAVALVPGCAFEYALADCAAGRLIDSLREPAEVEIVYHIRKAYTSEGTRKSILYAIAAPCFHLIGRLTQVPISVEVIKSKMNGGLVTVVAFPGGEPLMLPRHTNVVEVRTFMAAPFPSWILKAATRLAVPILRAASPLIRYGVGRSGCPTLEQRMNTVFEIIISARTAHQEKSINISGTDPYLLTAKIASAAAIYLDTNEPEVTGAIAPSQIAGLKFITDVLRESGVQCP